MSPLLEKFLLHLNNPDYLSKKWRERSWKWNWYKKYILCRYHLLMGMSYLKDGWHNHPEQ